MQKLVAIVLSAVLACSVLAGCGASDPTKDFTENQKTVYNTAKEFKETARYKEVAKDDSKIEVLNAVEVTIDDMDGQSVHALIMEVDADMDMYGVNAGILVVDLDDKNVYDDTMIDWDALGNGITSHELALQMLVNSGDSYFHNNSGLFWTELETRVEMTDTDIEAVNKALAK